MKSNRTLLLMCLAAMTLQGLVGAINLAIPQLAVSALHPTASQLVWVVDTYVLVFAAFLIPAGALGDRLGRKGVLVTGLMVFAVANLICALAPDVAVLQAGRALAGLGAALALPSTMALVLHNAPPERRSAWIAAWASALGLGSMVGNIVAGAVLEWFDWRALFAVFVVVALVISGAVTLGAPQAPRHETRLERLPTVILIGALFTLLFAIIEGPDRGWSDGWVLGSFGASAVLFALFAVYGGQVAALFRLGTVRAGGLGVGVGFLAMFALFYMNAQFLQDVKGYSTLVTGFAVAPVTLGMAVVTRPSVSLVARFGSRVVVGLGLFLTVLGLLAMSFVRATTPYPLYAVFLVIVAMGAGVSAPALTGELISEVPPSQSGLASGIGSACREVGAALGIAIAGTVLNTHHALGSRTAFVSGMETSYRLVALTLAVVTVVVLATWRKPGVATPSFQESQPVPQG